MDSRSALPGSQDNAVDRLTGELRWKVETGSRVPRSGPQAGETMYFGSCDAWLYAVDVASGVVRWKFETEHDEGRGVNVYCSPLVFGEDVYLATLPGKLCRVASETGKLSWKTEPVPNSEVVSDVISDGKRLFLTTRKNSNGGGESTVIALPR